MKKARERKKPQLIAWIAGAVSLLFVLLLIVVGSAYRLDGASNFISPAINALPLPAAYIRGAGFIWVGELREDLAAVRKFYESQDFEQVGMRVDFSTDQGKKRLKVKEKEILNKLAENKIITALANERGIEITDEMIDREVDAGIQEYGNRQNLMSELKRLYGWTLAEFKQKVVKPELYAERLGESHAATLDIAPAEQKIQTLYERVAKKKEDFEKVAREFSEGESSKDGGDLGWSTQDQLIAEIAEGAFSLSPGQVSEIIASPLGFHILKLEEKKNEGDEEIVRLRQIFVRTQSFGDWLQEQMRKQKVLVFSKDYAWNSDAGQADFKDPKMRKFEEDLGANSQGDPSVFP